MRKFKEEWSWRVDRRRPEQVSEESRSRKGKVLVSRRLK